MTVQPLDAIMMMLFEGMRTANAYEIRDMSTGKVSRPLVHADGRAFKPSLAANERLHSIRWDIGKNTPWPWSITIRISYALAGFTVTTSENVPLEHRPCFEVAGLARMVNGEGFVVMTAPNPRRLALTMCAVVNALFIQHAHYGAAQRSARCVPVSSASSVLQGEATGKGSDVWLGAIRHSPFLAAPTFTKVVDLGAG